MAVQAFVGDTVYALNVSSPSADFVDWLFPADAYLVERNASRAGFVLGAPGNYTIRMLATKDDCQNSKQRDIRIFNRNDIGQTDPQLGYQNQISFGKVGVYPNPNYGKFSLQIELSPASDVSVSMYRSLNSALVYQTDGKGKSRYDFAIELKNFVQDVYVIVIRAGTSIYRQKVLIMN